MWGREGKEEKEEEGWGGGETVRHNRVLCPHPYSKLPPAGPGK